MSDDSCDLPERLPGPSREERLAAKLRENLRRRKMQARGLAGGTFGDPGALPKSPGKS